MRQPARELGADHGRDPERVRQDVVRGYVSPESAREDYGVAFKSDLSIDADATARLRVKAAS